MSRGGMSSEPLGPAAVRATCLVAQDGGTARICAGNRRGDAWGAHARGRGVAGQAVPYEVGEEVRGEDREQDWREVRESVWKTARQPAWRKTWGAAGRLVRRPARRTVWKAGGKQVREEVRSAAGRAAGEPDRQAARTPAREEVRRAGCQSAGRAVCLAALQAAGEEVRRAAGQVGRVSARFPVRNGQLAAESWGPVLFRCPAGVYRNRKPEKGKCPSFPLDAVIESGDCP